MKCICAVIQNMCVGFSDSNCVKMLDLGVVPHILTLLEQHVDEGDVSVQHAGLSALRNLAIPGTDHRKQYVRCCDTSTDRMLCVCSH